MNKRLTVFLLSIMVAIFITSGNVFAYMINDAVYTNPAGYLVDVYDNGDRIGKAEFELFGMNYHFNGSILTLDSYTNYPESGIRVGGVQPLPSDLALDIDGIANGYEYGIALRDHGTLTRGTLYRVNQWWNSYYPGYHYHPGLPVIILDGTWLSNGTATRTTLDTTSHHNLLPDYMLSTSLDLSKLSWGKDQYYLNFFYGGADCANDYLDGRIKVVPEPGTLTLFGLGLLGLVGLLRPFGARNDD